jgi:hypothetical protein
MGTPSSPSREPGDRISVTFSPPLEEAFFSLDELLDLPPRLNLGIHELPCFGGEVGLRPSSPLAPLPSLPWRPSGAAAFAEEAATSTLNLEPGLEMTELTSQSESMMRLLLWSSLQN